MYLKGIFTFNFFLKKCSLVSDTVDKQTQKYFKTIYFRDRLGIEIDITSNIKPI